MTADGWEASDDIQRMLAFVRRKTTARKKQLFACACCRLVWRYLTDPASRAAVETAERFADRMATPAALSVARRRAEAVAADLWSGAAAFERLSVYARRDAATAAAEAARRDVDAAAVASLVIAAASATPMRTPDLAAVLRETVGPVVPLPPFPDAWRTEQAVGIAAGVGGHDFAGLPVLADALEEAGCDHVALLAHLRGPGPHARGCWALDAVLGKS